MDNNVQQKVTNVKARFCKQGDIIVSEVLYFTIRLLLYLKGH